MDAKFNDERYLTFALGKGRLANKTLEILEKIGEADSVYIRVDQNKAYWVRGEESGSVDLW